MYVKKWNRRQNAANWGIFYQFEEHACMLHILSLLAHFSQNVKYWYEMRDILVPNFSRAVRNWYQFSRF